MPSDIPWTVRVRQHPGSTASEIKDEPTWSGEHQHRVGFRNRQDRRPGLTHEGDEQSWQQGDHDSEREDFSQSAKAESDRLRQKVQKGELVDFRAIVENEKDLHLRYPQHRPLGWRYVLDCTEDWVKNREEWPANVRRWQKEREEAKARSSIDGGDSEEQGTNESNSHGEENEWKRGQGENSKHHDAYATKDGARTNDGEEPADEYAKLSERYTPQEIALLQALQHEKVYRSQLKQNDGKQKSPQQCNRRSIAIDEQDQFSPDNWLPRSDHLIRLTGKHPLNAESELTLLFEGGLITPNELHYVRNHGPVPRVLWEFHKLDVNDGRLVLSMDDLTGKFESINIPVSLACDGNRRKELNMIKKSKGFNWGAGATGCAYWKGALLRDVLQAAHVNEVGHTEDGKLLWVNFEGADELSEGKYETCIPLNYAMDPSNDVILAYEMNDAPIPPDHGYPLRLIIPGYVGGRCVKWLRRIWITEYENQSHYHIWDNRVLPSFITEKDGEFATTMFHHQDTACNEQNLNSVIVRPAQGETLPLTPVQFGQPYRIQGYAYDGGGHEVQRVEVSLDSGETWLYCIRKFPEYPIRHGNKFWTWLHWYVDVSMVHLTQAKSISVRAWNVFKNTQPEHPSWNTMGMMNNCWYTVKPEIAQSSSENTPHILFRHPCEPGVGEGGWMKQSWENRIRSAKQAAGTPQKQFTRQEIEKHDTEDDCWLVVDGKVYDATSVLTWHPGGKAAIVGHAGKVHQETSDEFASIHDDFAYQKLEECVLGKVTEKAAQFMKANAEAAARENAKSTEKDSGIVLQKHKWTPVKLEDRKALSKDTRQYTFTLPAESRCLGLGTCQHIQIGFHLKDRMLIRSYTPTKPLLPDSQRENDTSHADSEEVQNMRDGRGNFQLVVKTYFPSLDQPGGAMSNILDCIPIGEEVEIRGPTGEIVYNGDGKFNIGQSVMSFKRISLVLGGSGITPGYALAARVALEPTANIEIRILDANKSEKDILLRDELKHFVEQSKGRMKVEHVLSHPSDDWKGLKGHVNEKLVKQSLFPPGKDSVVFLCGPPAMIQKAALPALKDWGYVEDQNIFGF